ncbi:hypothetical protein GBA65_07730 [Rubrobacter marinus]|uniref:GH29D-like beta-sandwich domain-containing protein n=1 Tax=Rubrobacter marinus TaxID=2653852 RepID=A0A6G8PW44_9ACTN|nr:chitobiase/beta-hexosaminidase C-terminal domain-containing protein [Rubrobacter marinus]QIN78432.1 hypothetical protein GBA65_07730 [Rubrobacter marinus]
MDTAYGKHTGRRVGLKGLLGASFTALALGVALASPSFGAVNGANRNLEVDYSLDFVLLEAYPANTAMRVDVLRGPNDVVVGSTTQQTDATGLLEINHLGGGAFPNGDCWGPNSLDPNAPDATPDILPGDKVQVTNTANTADVDFTFVRDLAFEEVGGAVVGTARGVETAPGTFDVAAPITGLVAEGDEFIEARREPAGVREFVLPDAAGNFNQALGGAGGDVTLQYVKPSAGANSFESTVAGPIGTAGGPATPECPAFSRTAITTVDRTVVNAANVGTPMVVSGVAQPQVSAVTVSVPGGQPNNATLGGPQGGQRTWQATVPAAELAALPQGDFVITASFTGNGVPPTDTKTMRKDTIPPVLTSDPAPGTYLNGVGVALISDGGEAIRFTTDGFPPNNNSRLYDGQRIPLGLGVHTINAFSVDGAGNRRDASFVYIVRQPDVIITPSSTALTVARSNLKLGQTRLISGRLTPAHPGRPVKVTIRRGGRIVAVRNVASTFSFRYKPTRTGLYSVRASFAGDADTRASISPNRTFRVIR